MPTSIDRNELVESLLSEVKGLPAMKGVQVERFPDDGREYVKRYLKSQKGAVLVSYAGARKRGGEGSASRQAVVDLVAIASRKADALGHIDELEKALDGRRLALSGGLGMVAFGADQFIREDNNRFQYLIKVHVTID